MSYGNIDDHFVEEYLLLEDNASVGRGCGRWKEGGHPFHLLIGHMKVELGLFEVLYMLRGPITWHH